MFKYVVTNSLGRHVAGFTSLADAEWFRSRYQGVPKMRIAVFLPPKSPVVVASRVSQDVVTEVARRVVDVEAVTSPMLRGWVPGATTTSLTTAMRSLGWVPGWLNQSERPEGKSTVRCWRRGPGASPVGVVAVPLPVDDLGHVVSP